jgi:hypothetical protein
VREYGEELAELTIGLVPQFIIDIKNLIHEIEKTNALK